MQLSQKRAVKRLIQQGAKRATGRAMSNKAAQKWLKKQPRSHPHTIGRRFSWPTVLSFPRAFFGLSRWRRFPQYDSVPFGWKEIRQGAFRESVLMPYWLYGAIAAWEGARRAADHVACYLMGVRRA